MKIQGEEKIRQGFGFCVSFYVSIDKEKVTSHGLMIIFLHPTTANLHKRCPSKKSRHRSFPRVSVSCCDTMVQ